MKNNTPQLASHRECTGCMACVDSCNHCALSSYIGEDGHYYVQTDEKACIGCLLCEKVCPVVSDMKYGQSNLSEFYAVWNKNNDERLKSASGGAFSAMAHYVIERGGVVIGAAIDNICDVNHVVVDSLNELYKLQGSKYTQSNTKGIFDKTYKHLREGKFVLFSGTGCQVAGLLSYLKNRKYTGRLITVDLICGGVSSKLLLQKFVENEPYKIKRIKSFRTKDHGWKPKGFVYNMKVEDTNGMIHDYTGIKNLITTGFSTELTNRYSCYDCKFIGSNRLSDFTIGDLWGDKEFPQEHYRGLSMLVVHNGKALRLLNEMKGCLSLFHSDEVQAKKHNYRLIDGKNSKGKSLERKFMPWIFAHCSYNVLKKIYANDYSNYSPWLILKICMKLFS